jgi:hypothetical protein
MPSKDTFSIHPIKNFINRHIKGSCIVDPFVGLSPFKSQCSWVNDLDPSIPAHRHQDALSFLTNIASDSVDFLFFDPPYSPRQVSECYKSLGLTVNMQTTQSSYWGNMKKEIARIIKSDGLVLTCGWNSGGIGKTKGFEIIEILLVAHGGWHNDTIVTLERKL